MRNLAFQWWALAGFTLCLMLAGCHRAQPHHVTLTWDPPPPVPNVTIVSYNIYRSTTSGGPFVKLAAAVARPPYEDGLVNRDRTYFYVVTAVDKIGRESRRSGEVRAVIP
jgi:fibronectin type 3 domain-containing protein